MGAKPNYRRKKYGPLARKTLSSALQSCLAKDFPQLGGPRMQKVAAERILEVILAHLHVRDAVRHGQVAWTGIALQQRTVWRQRIEDMQLVPLVLDLVTPQDLEAVISCEPPPKRLLARCLRLCRQAHQQGGLLSNCDLAVLLGTHDSAIASLLADWERDNDQLVPRRATLHDVGTGLTHKRWICWKRYAEGKTSEQVARETYHQYTSPRAIREAERLNGQPFCLPSFVSTKPGDCPPAADRQIVYVTLPPEAVPNANVSCASRSWRRGGLGAVSPRPERCHPRRLHPDLQRLQHRRLAHQHDQPSRQYP